MPLLICKVAPPAGKLELWCGMGFWSPDANEVLPLLGRRLLYHMPALVGFAPARVWSSAVPAYVVMQVAGTCGMQTTALDIL